MRAVNCHPSPPNQQAPTPSVPKCLSLENRVSLTDAFFERLPFKGRSSIYYPSIHRPRLQFIARWETGGLVYVYGGRHHHHPM
jgi:hypothetical protein